MPYYVPSVAGETQEITINFSPDHETSFYADVLHIQLNGQVHAFVMYTLGLVQREYRFQYNAILKVIRAGVGFGSGTETNTLFIHCYIYISLAILTTQLSYSVHLKGCGWSNNMYVLDGETIGPREESMGAVISPPDDHPPPAKSLLVILVCHSVEEENLPVTKEIQIGCIKTPLVKKVSFSPVAIN